MNKKPSFIFSADIIRVLAIFGVLFIHTIDAVNGRPDFFGGVSWWFGIILDSLSRIAIPLFILLSGYLILSKDETLTQTLKRTLNRIFIPLISWFLLYSWWNNGNPSLLAINLSLIIKLFSVNVFHLYFLIIMLGLYITAPLIRSYLHTTASSEHKKLMILLIIAGILEVICQYIFQRCSMDNIFTYWIPYSGLFVAGFVLGNESKSIKTVKPLIIFYSLGLIITIFFNYMHFFWQLRNVDFLGSVGCLTYYSDYYLSIPVLLMAFPAFMLLLHFQYHFLKTKHIISAIHSLSKASFGIYLIHLFILSILNDHYHLFDHIAPAWLYIVIKWLTILVVSYLFTIIFMKIPFVNRVFGVKNNN